MVNILIVYAHHDVAAAVIHSRAMVAAVPVSVQAGGARVAKKVSTHAYPKPAQVAYQRPLNPTILELLKAKSNAADFWRRPYLSATAFASIYCLGFLLLKQDRLN